METDRPYIAGLRLEFQGKRLPGWSKKTWRAKDDPRGPTVHCNRHVVAGGKRQRHGIAVGTWCKHRVWLWRAMCAIYSLTGNHYMMLTPRTYRNCVQWQLTIEVLRSQWTQRTKSSKSVHSTVII